MHAMERQWNIIFTAVVAVALALIGIELYFRPDPNWFTKLFIFVSGFALGFFVLQSVRIHRFRRRKKSISDHS